MAFSDDHTRPEEVDIPEPTGRDPIRVALKHVNAFQSNIKTSHQIRPTAVVYTVAQCQILCLPRATHQYGAAKVVELGQFEMDSVVVKSSDTYNCLSSLRN